MARKKRRRQTDEDIPEGLKEMVVTAEDDEKRTVTVYAISPGKGRIKLNEWQTASLADGLSKIVQEWSNEKIISATVKCIAEGINEALSGAQTGDQR
jgi:hypothetical protein